MTTSTALNACLAEHGIVRPARAFGGTASWQTVDADLSAYTGGDLVKVRFLFVSGASLQYEGWYIRSVHLGGVQVLGS